jgi:hypothetical protein
VGGGAPRFARPVFIMSPVRSPAALLVATTGAPCVDRNVGRFLLEGRLPRDGTRCR